MYIYLLIKFLLCVIVTPNQIERLYSRFTSLDRGDCGTLSREDFLRIPELAINPLGDRIVNAFFDESGNDRVNFLQFMQVLAHFRPIKKNSPNRLNSRQEKLKCKLIMSWSIKSNKIEKNFKICLYYILKFFYISVAFKMYDLDNDDLISKDELLAILHMMVGANIR